MLLKIKSINNIVKNMGMFFFSVISAITVSMPFYILIYTCYQNRSGFWNWTMTIISTIMRRPFK